MNASLALRVYVWSEVRKAFFTYCWVIVDPPCVAPPVRFDQKARRIPVGETPRFS